MIINLIKPYVNSNNGLTSEEIQTKYRKPCDLRKGKKKPIFKRNKTKRRSL